MAEQAQDLRGFEMLRPGDPAPWFSQRCGAKQSYNFDVTAGRYVVLCFFGSAGDPLGREACGAVMARKGFFDDQRASFFGVSIDPSDEAEDRVRNDLPGVRIFWDFDGTVSRLYGSIARRDELPLGPLPARRFWLVLDSTLRVMARIPFGADSCASETLFAFLDGLPEPDQFAGFEVRAPILILPNVFEPDLCRELMAMYDAHGGQESGFMREIGGKTVGVHDPGFKRRKDFTIADATMIHTIQSRFLGRVFPEIRKVHHFKVTRMERYLVACYDSADGGHFHQHRDNTTKGTAHRKFAASVNLNAEFDGGDIRFPEYGPRAYRPPPGGVVVFSCSLLHAVTRVTRGRRFAFLPFLYDDSGAELRKENSKYVVSAATQTQEAPADSAAFAPPSEHQRTESQQ
jgi:peroxiredoxin/predicted 2-oxoglutarate/Fe(II)-dependent dioxygenase YbiX